MAVTIGKKFIEKFVLKKLAERSGKRTGITTIKNVKDPQVQFNIEEVSKTIKSFGIDPNDVKSVAEVEKIMNIRKAVSDQTLKNQFKNLGLDKGVDDLAKKPPFQGFTPTVVPNKRAEILKKYTKDGQPNDVELNALANEHRILSAEAKKLGDAGENYEKFSQLNKRTDEIQEILDFMNKEFPEGMASGGRIGYAQGTKKPGERYYLPTKGKEWLHSMPEIDPYKKFFRRQNKLMKFKDSKGLAEILGV